ncbi:hypothetical protein FE257_012571 [Aspergillus nanangensis]|uniref:Uncharacterized protein n=1 Tax=Aspergillus nanangensis TaxID=2582783 RepID=A0AAD4GWU9_ASPNN|nr:hypothetical protein FE257_012571 [Aspergillus nanangensis]
MSLLPNTLYIVLYIRTDPPIPDNFHWALYHHHPTVTQRTKYHITNEGSDGWIASHSHESNILKTFLLVGLVRIADVSVASISTVDQVIRSYDSQVNTMDVTCRTWLLRVLSRLQMSDLGVLRGIDLDILEKEVKAWGNRFAKEACVNVQPRPVGEIIDPQSAVLTNVEVLAYLTANPPRRPPNPPPNSRHWVPSPDLRDHNTVVKEIHNYVSRLSPHLLNYPSATISTPHTSLQQQIQHQQQQQSDPNILPPQPIDNTPTPLDNALRDLVVRLQPYGLTKGEVLTIVNLGVGVTPPAATEEAEEGSDENADPEQQQGLEAERDQDQAGGEEEEEPHVNGVEHQQNGDGMMDVEEEAGETPEEDYGALALLDTVIEEREQRLSDADVAAILAIIRESLLGVS